MAREQAPAATVFHECVGKLKLEIEWFVAGDSLCVRPAGDDCSVTMDAHFHVVILEDFVFGIVFSGFIKIVGTGGNFAHGIGERVIFHHALFNAVRVTLEICGGKVAFCPENCISLITLLRKRKR